MAKVTSKLQVSIPKAIADEVGIRPGDSLSWELIGSELRARRDDSTLNVRDVLDRLREFDAATARQDLRERSGDFAEVVDRGWSRDDLYAR